MTNERIIELVNNELDGTNSPDESAELANILQKDESARALFDETKALFGVLENVPYVEPPVDLKDRIMESVEQEASVSRQRAETSRQPRLAESLKRIFSPQSDSLSARVAGSNASVIFRRPGWAMSYAFAAGLLLGVAAWALIVQPGGPDAGVVQGTMGQPPSGVLDEASLHVGDIIVDLATLGLNDEVVLDVTLSGKGDSRVEIQSTSDASRGTSIIASGPGHFTVSLDEVDGLIVSVTSSGQEDSVRLVASSPS